MKHSVRPWQEVSRQEVFRKYNRVIDKVEYILPDGQKRDFYIKNEKRVVCVLALTKEQKVILAKQFRPGPKEILSELPGGAMEDGETPIQAMERELLEESGYKGNLQLVTEAVDCAYSTRWRYCFVATECEKVAEPQNSETEPIEIALVLLHKFREILRSGKITDIEVGYLGLDYLKLL